MKNIVRTVCGGVALVAMLALVGPAFSQINAGNRTASLTRPFTETAVASFQSPWAIAILPDTRMLVTEKPGHLFLVTSAGEKTEVTGVPKVAYEGQNGLLDVAISPSFGTDDTVYLSFSEPGTGGSSLALGTGRLTESGTTATLADFKVIWRQEPAGPGGQPGGIIAFSPDGTHLFLTSGDRMRPETAQDPEQAMGKVLRLNLDGSTPSDNPMASEGGVAAQIWTLGHRNPYGLAFDAAGQLWLHEMGPKGGDELNLLKPGSNYGWPVVSNGDNYNGTPIPRHDTPPEFQAPALYWNPVIAPAGLAFYEGDLFPQWKGSALIGGLQSRALVRVTFDGKGGADEAERWDMGQRIRDVAVAADGAVWLIEDSQTGRLLRLTPTP